MSRKRRPCSTASILPLITTLGKKDLELFAGSGIPFGVMRKRDDLPPAVSFEKSVRAGEVERFSYFFAMRFMNFQHSGDVTPYSFFLHWMQEKLLLLHREVSRTAGMSSLFANERRSSFIHVC